MRSLPSVSARNRRLKRWEQLTAVCVCVCVCVARENEKHLYPPSHELPPASLPVPFGCQPCAVTHGTSELTFPSSALTFVHTFHSAWFDLIHNLSLPQFTSAQLLSRVRLFVTPWIAACQASLSITNSHSSLKLTSIHRVSDAIQPSHPLSSPSPPSPNPSQHQSLFQWVNSVHEVAKVLEFQLQHHSFQRNPRADLLQNGLVGSPCSPRDSQESSPTPQFKIINSSALSLHSPSLTSIRNHGKTIALTRRTFVGKVMSLLLNMLSQLVITFLPRSKCLLISWL